MTLTTCTSKNMIVFTFHHHCARNVSSLGLTHKYRRIATNTQKCVFKLFGLLFLPLEDVIETFECIVENEEEFR